MFYDFLHLDCYEFKFSKLSAKIITFRTARFKLALFVTVLYIKKSWEEIPKRIKNNSFWKVWFRRLAAD